MRGKLWSKFKHWIKSCHKRTVFFHVILTFLPFLASFARIICRSTLSKPFMAEEVAISAKSLVIWMNSTVTQRMLWSNFKTGKCKREIFSCLQFCSKTSLLCHYFRCQCNESCSIDDFNDFFGDPCRGTSKYVKVIHECLPPPKEKLCPVPNKYELPPNTTMNVTNEHACGLGMKPGTPKVM